MEEAWFFYLLNPASPGISDEDLKSACYWYLKTITTIEDEKDLGFSRYFYGPSVQISENLRGLMGPLNCPSRF